MSFQKNKFEYIGVISIALTVFFLIANLINSYIITFRYPGAETYDLLLENYYSFNVVYIVDTILILLSVIFLIPSIICILIIYRNCMKMKKNLAFLPAFAIFYGVIMLISIILVKFYLILGIAPLYSTASYPIKVNIINLFEEILNSILYAQAFSNILIYTIGAGVFGVLNFIHKIFRDISSWLAILCGVFQLGFFGIFIPTSFGFALVFLSSLGSVIFIFWLISITSLFQEKIKQKKMNLSEPS